MWVKALNLLLSKARDSDKDDAIDDYLEKLWNKADEDRSASLTYDECCKVNSPWAGTSNSRLRAC
jgi:hypothetical protein